MLNETNRFIGVGDGDDDGDNGVEEDKRRDFMALEVVMVVMIVA